MLQRRIIASPIMSCLAVRMVAVLSETQYASVERHLRLHRYRNQLFKLFGNSSSSFFAYLY